LKKLTLAAVVTIAMLFETSRVEAFTDTKIVVSDGGSIVIHADGLDDASNFTLTQAEMRHKNAGGVLNTVQISEGGVTKCTGASCGVAPGKSWKIQVNYGPGSLTLWSTSKGTGFHVTNNKLPFDSWTKRNTDERDFGHGDGNKISSVKVNGGPNLCAGKGCTITLTYTPK
jgi:hypothetical protein